MKKCPYCSSQIQENATFCIFCMGELTSKKAVPISKNNKNIIYSVFVTIAVILFFVIALTLPMFFKNKSSATFNFSADRSENTGDTALDTPESNEGAIHSPSDDNQQTINEPKPSDTTKESSTDTPTPMAPIFTTAPTPDTTVSAPDTTVPTPDTTVPTPDTTVPTPDGPGTKSIWSYQETDGGIEITGLENNTQNGNYTLPDLIDGKTVVGIGQRAFYYNTSIKSITLPDTLLYIGDQAFYHVDGLTSIIIPKSVTQIGNNAFTQCYYLSEVYIKSEQIQIASYAFSTTYQRGVELTLYAPKSANLSMKASLYWDANYVEWNG